MATVAHGEIGELAFTEGVPLAAGSARSADLTVVWVSEPTASQLDQLRERFGAAQQLLTEESSRHARARVDRLGAARFVSLSPARYLDAEERVEFGELQLLLMPGVVLLVERGGCFVLDRFIAGLEGRSDLLSRGPNAVAHAAISRVLDDYEPVLAGLENDIDEIEDQVFASDADPLRRIYELIREVLVFQRATDPLDELLGVLAHRPDATEPARHHARDLRTRAQHTSERVAGFRALLENALNVNLTLETKRLSELSIQQNEQMKKLSAWAAILFTPTLITGIYGMNFRHMPELHWVSGYPLSIVLMLAVGFGLWAVFKRRDWI